MRTPFEQFEIINLSPGMTNSLLVQLISLFVMLALAASVYKVSKLVSRNYQLTIEDLQEMNLKLLKDNGNSMSQTMIEPIFALLVAVFLWNLIGMIPYSYTVTSQFVVTLALTLIIWIGKLAVGIDRHGVKLFAILRPSGLPLAMTPFFIIIEGIGFFIPLVSLSVRLFANLMSGHVLMKVIFGFSFLIYIEGGYLSAFSSIPLVILLMLIALELAVALIQAYVFILLSSLYVGEMVKGAH